MKTARHEVIIRFKDQYLVLLPTLRAIAALECHFATSMGNLLTALSERGLSNEQCSYIIWIGAYAAENNPSYAELLQYVEKEDATKISTVLEDFFFAALDADPARPVIETGFFPWNDMQHMAFTALDLLPHEFWNLTFAEFKQFVFGFDEKTLVNPEDLGNLIARHPDTPTHR